MLGTVATSVTRIPTEYRVAFDKLLEWLQCQEQQHPGAYKHEHITTSVILDLVETRYLVRIWFKDDILSLAEAGITEQLRRLIQVAKALEHLHRHNIVHGHLYPGNIFINAKGDATITDVSYNMFARAFEPQELVIPIEPSSVYHAPEALDPCQTDLHPSSDVFSFASTAYSVMTGHAPADISSVQSIRDSIRYISLFGISRIIKPPATPDNLWQVLEKCWSFNPEARPTMTDVIFDLEDIFLYM